MGNKNEIKTLKKTKLAFCRELDCKLIMEKENNLIPLFKQEKISTSKFIFKKENDKKVWSWDYLLK